MFGLFMMILDGAPNKNADFPLPWTTIYCAFRKSSFPPEDDPTWRFFWSLKIPPSFTIIFPAVSPLSPMSGWQTFFPCFFCLTMESPKAYHVPEGSMTFFLQFVFLKQCCSPHFSAPIFVPGEVAQSYCRRLRRHRLSRGGCLRTMWLRPGRFLAVLGCRQVDIK